jgi:hypothetical protein
MTTNAAGQGPALSEGLGPLVEKRATVRLRWKKEPRETGLRAVGASPRSSKLHDGVTEYATVYPHGGGWRQPLRGWFWVTSTEAVGEYVNTHANPLPDEDTAKAEAMMFVKAALAKRA